MSPANGTVNNKRLHIGVRDEVLVHLCEDPFITPPGKPLVKGVPITIGGWQKASIGHRYEPPTAQLRRIGGLLLPLWT